jgi:hypothetical protein
MPQLDFYNTNANRAYPLQATDSEPTFGGVILPEGVLLDAGFLAGDEATVDVDDYVVRLVSIERTATELKFNFTIGVALSFSFTRTLADKPGRTNYESAVEGVEHGTAFLVTGELLAFFDSLPEGVHLADNECRVEESLFQALRFSAVRMISLAAQAALPWSSAAYCAGEVSSEEAPYVLTGSGFVGSLKIKAGYNATIRQSTTDNSIEIGGLVGAGEGEPCGEIVLPVAPDEFVPPTGGQLGGVSCGEVVQSIGGVAPSPTGEFTLRGHNGIKVTPYPDEHKVVVEFLVGNDSPTCGLYPDPE